MIRFEQISKKFALKGGNQKYIFRDLTLSVPRRNLAILGKNGAGKSTMISLIAGTIMPDRGKIIREGNISWPIGLQSGFQGSLTGRENVLFVCRIQGCSLHATKKKVAFVEEFAELDKHFDMPVKTYSSGMRAKLGFGLSMAFDFDVYLIDEVTAVGDVSFQKKATQAFEEKRNKANLIVVSHDMYVIKQWCDAGLYLENGICQFYENIDEAISRYQAM